VVVLRHMHAGEVPGKRLCSHRRRGGPRETSLLPQAPRGSQGDIFAPKGAERVPGRRLCSRRHRGTLAASALPAEPAPHTQLPLCWHPGLGAAEHPEHPGRVVSALADAGCGPFLSKRHQYCILTKL